jgi:hypothetical protein
VEPSNLERLHREIDRALAGRTNDTSDLAPAEQRLVELARALTDHDMNENSLHKATLRRQLEQRTLHVVGFAGRAPSLLVSWAGVALAVAFFVFSVANSLSYNFQTASHLRETLFAAPALEQGTPVDQPKSQPLPAMIPRPVPTPLAPLTATLGATMDPAQAASTPGLGSISHTP